MKLLRLLACLAGASLAQPAASAECMDLSGVWNLGGPDPDPSDIGIEIRQTGCKELRLTQYLGRLKSDTVSIPINDTWVCEPGTEEKLRCVKARWRSPSDILITKAFYEESCLWVEETYLESPVTLVSEGSTSCPGRSGERDSSARYEKVPASKK